MFISKMFSELKNKETIQSTTIFGNGGNTLNCRISCKFYSGESCVQYWIGFGGSVLRLLEYFSHTAFHSLSFDNFAIS